MPLKQQKLFNRYLSTLIWQYQEDKHLVRLGLGIRGSLVEMLGLQANQYLSFTKEMNISASPTGIL